MDTTNDRILAGLMRDLEELTEDYENQKQEYESAIADRKVKLLADASKPGTGLRNIPVKPGQYKGMEQPAALQAYLTESEGLWPYSST